MSTRSGRSWVTWANTHAPNSANDADLAEPFRSQARAFIAALRAAGATVNVTSTLRSERRAYLFHWSWKIALGRIAATDAPLRPDVDIEWDHGMDAASKAGAQEMVSGFGLAVPPKSTNAPALSSNHIRGTAVDMLVTWTGTVAVRDKSGTAVVVPFMPDANANLVLHRVGASYGVLKLRTDAPHWSANGM